MPKLYLADISLLPTIITSGGKWEVKSISTDEARAAAQCASSYEEVVSTVEDETAAAVMADLLEVDIQFDRGTITPQDGDRILAFKLDQRLPMGVVPSGDEYDALDFWWFWFEYLG